MARDLESTNGDSLALGLYYQRVQDWARAEQCFRDIINHQPHHASALYHLGTSLQGQGKLGEAVDVLRSFLQFQPEHADAHTSLGIALGRLGRPGDALPCLREAIRLRPDHAKAHNNLGVALGALGRRDDAIAAWVEAIRVQPDYSEAYFNHAVVLAEKGEKAEAIAVYRRAIQLRPDYAEAYNNLGVLVNEGGKSAEAVMLLRQATRLNPSYVEAHNNLGLVLVDLGRAEEAIASYEQALRLRPTDVDLHSNIGTAFAAAGRHDEALASYEVALLLEPNHPETHWHRALSLLEIGNFADGWQEYEWRWKRKRANSRSLPKPLWSGDSLKDQTILLYCEQGLGDTLQFVRYARLVKERIGTVVLECPASMISLLSTCPGIDRLVAEGDPLPDFDVQAPLMSLPGILKVTRPLGASAPYVGADPDLTRSWCEELGKYDGVKVGIAWQGNPKHRWDRHRSLPLRQFLPLTRVPGIRLFSLQKGFGTEQLEQVESEARLIDLGNRIDPAGGMTDAAAVIQSLDLIVTCDSALAHLAAALGKPTWILIAHRSDWRWLRDREDSPWYSSVRLFRQKSPGDWQEVMGRVVSAAADLVAGGSTPEPIQVDHGHGKYTYTSSPAQSGSEISCANHARTDDTLRKAHHRRETGELQQAAFLYRKALHENPEHAGAYFHLGEILRKTKDLDEAAFQFREAIKRQPAFAEAQLLLADTLHEQKKADEAIHWYRRFLELRPDQPDAHNHLGILLAERGLYDEAIPHFQTLIKLQPDRIGAYHNIAVALADQGKLDVPLPEMFAVLAA